MFFLYLLSSMVFGALYIYELVAYHIHDMEWLLFFMFFSVMLRFEELRY